MDFTANKEGTCLLPPAWGMTTNRDRSAEVKTQARELFLLLTLSPRYCHVEIVPHIKDHLITEHIQG